MRFVKMMPTFLFIVLCCMLVSCASNSDRSKDEILVEEVDVRKESKREDDEMKEVQGEFKVSGRSKINEEAKAIEKAYMQKTFGMIKPSGINKSDEIKNIIKMHSLKIIDSKRIVMSESDFEKLYFMHKDRPFFNDLKLSLVGKEVEVMIIYGNNAIAKYREVVKKIREKYAVDKTYNFLHGTDETDIEDENGRKLGGKERAKEEICIFFKCEK